MPAGPPRFGGPRGAGVYRSGVQVGVLGWLRAQGADGGEVELGGPLERRVLAVLVLRAGDVVSLDTLADAVFGEQSTTGATIRLQNHVSRLRKRLGAGAVVTVAPGYRLDVDVVELDWCRFEELIGAATGVLLSDPVRAGELLEEALSLWRGCAVLRSGGLAGVACGGRTARGVAPGRGGGARGGVGGSRPVVGGGRVAGRSGGRGAVAGAAVGGFDAGAVPGRPPSRRPASLPAGPGRARRSRSGTGARAARRWTGPSRSRTRSSPSSR